MGVQTLDDVSFVKIIKDRKKKNTFYIGIKRHFLNGMIYQITYINMYQFV